MSLSPPPSSCAANVLSEIVGILITEIPVTLPLSPNIVPGLERASNTFEANAPEDTQSSIYSDTVACLNESTTLDVTTLRSTLDVTTLVSVLIVVVVCIGLSVVIIKSTTTFVAIYIVILFVCMFVGLLSILSDTPQINFYSEECAKEAKVREEIYEEQLYRSVNSALCSY